MKKFIILILISLIWPVPLFSEYNWLARIEGPSIKNKERVFRKEYRFLTDEGDYIFIEFLYHRGKQNFKRPTDIILEKPSLEFKNKISYSLIANRHITFENKKIKIYLKYESFINQQTKEIVYHKKNHGISPVILPTKQNSSYTFKIVSTDGTHFNGHYRAVKVRRSKEIQNKIQEKASIKTNDIQEKSSNKKNKIPIPNKSKILKQHDPLILDIESKAVYIDNKKIYIKYLKEKNIKFSISGNKIKIEN